MNFESQQCEVAVTNDPVLIDALRRRKLVHRDENGEFIWGQFEAKSIPFYLNKTRTLPADAAKNFVSNSKTEVDVPCPNCEGKKSTPAGICIECKGMGLTHAPQHGGYPVRALSIVRTFENALRELKPGVETCPFCSGEFSNKDALRAHLQESCAAPEAA